MHLMRTCPASADRARTLISEAEVLRREGGTKKLAQRVWTNTRPGHEDKDGVPTPLSQHQKSSELFWNNDQFALVNISIVIF